MPHDPIASPTTPVAENREPAFVFPEQAAAAQGKLAALRTQTGRPPNVLIVLMDDVGWGDFGCYGGGVAVGAPTPNIDRLAREGLLLTSCYSEPSCTPSRASLMTGRLPMRHGLQRPPMYGEPGGLAGRDHARAAARRTRATSTQAVGKWHMGENAESQPQNVGFDDFYGFLSVSDMYTEWRDPYFFPEIVYSEERTKWVENQPFNKCFVHATQGRRARRTSRRSRSRCCRCSTTSGATYSVDFIERMAGERQAVVPLPLHARRALRQLPARALPRLVAGEAPVQGHDRRARRHRRAAGRGAARRRGQLENTLIFVTVGQRPGDGDLARRRVLAVPLREGLDVGGRRARAGRSSTGRG